MTGTRGTPRKQEPADQGVSTQRGLVSCHEHRRPGRDRGDGAGPAGTTIAGQRCTGAAIRSERRLHAGLPRLAIPGSPRTTSARLSPARRASMSRSSTPHWRRRPLRPAACPRMGNVWPSARHRHHTAHPADR